MPFQMIREDITRMRVDAIVNAANTRLQAGGGVCGAIFARAGRKQLQAACDAIGHCPEGKAVITPGFNLPARFVIHTPGPVWQGGGHGEPEALRSCYMESLKLAQSRGLESVAFPLISAGIYGYPKRAAMDIAVSAIADFLREHDILVYLVLYDGAAFALSAQLERDIQAFIDDRYVAEHFRPEDAVSQRMREFTWRGEPTLSGGAHQDDTCFDVADAGFDEVSFNAAHTAPAAAAMPRVTANTGSMPAVRNVGEEESLEDALARISEGFSQRLFRLIDERGLTDPQVYKRANLDRKLFSKIRTKPDYRPGKNTVLALCVALRLNLDQTEDLLSRAGLALSPGSKGDLIVEYFIRHRQYDVYTINEALFAFDQELLGARG